MNKHRFRGRIALSGLLLILSCCGSAFAQSDEPSPPTQNRGALYYLGEQDELLMRVNIWGFVQRPGQYMVPKDTDLISLISFAGGPREYAKIKRIKVIRNHADAGYASTHNSGVLGMTDVAKNGDAAAASPSHDPGTTTGDDKVFEVNVKRYLKTGNANLIPALEPGDTIVIEGSAFHSLSKALDFAAKVAVIVNLYYLVKIASR